MYAILAAKHSHEFNNPARLDQYRQHVREFDFSTITYPVNAMQIQNFEKVNNLVAVWAHYLVKDTPKLLYKSNFANRPETLHIFYHENHWMPVVNLNALYKNKRVGSFYKCVKCFKSFYDNKLYTAHSATCDGSKITQNETVPEPAVLKFTDHDKTVDMGLVMYADIEAYLRWLDMDETQKTIKTQQHYPIAIGSMVIAKMEHNELHEKYVEFKGEDCMSHYIDYLEHVCRRIYEWDPTTRIKADRKPEEWREFNRAIKCYMCAMVFNREKGVKILIMTI